MNSDQDVRVRQLLLMRVELLRAAMEIAANDICSEFCGHRHHPVCLSATQALAQDNELQGRIAEAITHEPQ